MDGMSGGGVGGGGGGVGGWDGVGGWGGVWDCVAGHSGWVGIAG